MLRGGLRDPAFGGQLLPVVLYAIIALLFTWPVFGELFTHVAGEGGDPWQTLWRFETKARGGLDLFVTDVLGRGEARLANLSVWPWMPLHLVFGQPVAYNLVWVLSFILSGYAMYLLVRYLIGSSGYTWQVLGAAISVPALLAGLYYMLLPYHVAHGLGHFGAMQTQWLPFVILTTLVWWKRPTVVRTILLAVLLTIQAWTEHHYMLWLAIFAVLTALFWWRHLWQQLKTKYQATSIKYQALGLLGLLMLGVVLPYVPTARLALAENTPLELGRQQLVRFSADAFSFVTPAPFHSVWGGAADTLFASNFTGNVSEATQYLGISVLLLIIFFHRAIPRAAKRFWVATAVVFGVLALGPQLHVFGIVTNVPLPYELIDSLPGIASVRAVARAGVFVGLALAVLLGYVLARHLHRRGAALGAAAIILLEFMFVPAATQSAGLTPAYEALRSVPGSGVIEIPAATNYVAASKALVGSLTHGKEVVANIALERAQDPTEIADIKALPALKQLLFVRLTDLREGRTEFFNQDLSESLPDAMAWVGAEAIMIHTDSVTPLQRATLTRFLDAQPSLSGRVYDDVILYVRNDLQPQTDGVLLTRDKRWEAVGYDPDRDATFGEVADEAAVTLVNVTQETKQVSLVVPLAPESPGGIAIRWQDDVIASGEQFALPPGAHTVTLQRTGQGKAIVRDPVLFVATP